MAANTNATATVAGSTPISTSAYTQVFSSTAPNVTQLVISNCTDQNLIIAVGASGSELDLIAVVKGGQDRYVCLTNAQIPPGSRIAVKAAGAATTSGYVTVSLV